MQDAFVILLTGLSLGSVFAAMAVGIVITYKGTGVTNFAAGALGAWCAFVYHDLHDSGTLQLPLAGVPASVHVSGDGLPVVAAVLIAVLYGMAMGTLIYLLVFRPLRNSPTLAKVVASIGVMLVVQALIAERFGTDTPLVDPVLPAELVTIGGLPVPRATFWLAGVTVALALAVAVFYRRTRWGLAMQASAQSPFNASLAGFSPTSLGVMVWAGATGLIGFVSVLAAPVVGLDVNSFVMYVIPGLACALVGRLSAVVPAAVAGLVLGMINAEMTFLGTKTWWPGWANQGATAAVPFVVIVIILAVRGTSISARGQDTVRKLPAVHRPRIRPVLATGWFVAAVAALALTHDTIRFGLITTLAFGVIALSIVVITGMLGQVSLAQAAFAGIGGFAVAKLGGNLGLGFPWAPLLAAAIAAVCGVIVGLPALRIRGAHLAVVTLALAFAAEQFVFGNQAINSPTGNPVPAPGVFGLDLSVRGSGEIARLPFAIMCLVVLALCMLGVANLMRSETGRRFLAVRSNERASASVGISVTSAKLLGFGISAFLAGLGGSLIAYSQGSVSVSSFTAMVGVSWLAYVYLGGIGSQGGALVGAGLVTLGVVYVIVDRFVGVSGSGYLLVAALALVVTVIVNPQGMAGKARDLLGRLGPRIRNPDNPSSRHRGAETRQTRSRRAPAAGSLRAPETLEFVDLSVHYGGVVAVSHVGIVVEPGNVVGLIGANGAGKTSVIDAASGFTPYTGSVTLGGRTLDGSRAHRRHGQGLARTWQSSELFADLTVLENVQVAVETGSVRTVLADLVRPGRTDKRGEAMWWLDWFGLGALCDRRPDDLSLGQQKLVGLARAVCGRPSVLMADEPAAGLSSIEARTFGELLRRIATEHGVGVLLVEHDVELVTAICDDVYVLDFGRIIAHGAPAAVRDDPAVAAAYLGGTATDAAPVQFPPAVDEISVASATGFVR